MKSNGLITSIKRYKWTKKFNHRSFEYQEKRNERFLKITIKLGGKNKYNSDLSLIITRCSLRNLK